MTKYKYKSYRVHVELDIHIKENALVAHDPDSIASAVRHALRHNMPTSAFTQGGYKFDANSVHAEVVTHPGALKPLAHGELEKIVKGEE